MDVLRIALPVGLAVLLLLGWWIYRRRGTVTAQAEQDRIDTLVGWPPQATRAMSQRECAAYARLVDALPDHMVLAQVPLSRFLSVPKRYSYADWLRRLGYQCVDFAVCDASAQVVAVVELQPAPALASERTRKRLARMARSLKAAKIALHVWDEKSLPTVQKVREALIPAPPTQQPEPDEAAKPATTPPTEPVPAFNPFEDAGRDSTQDERIELLEPPPSTWFDDLDTQPAPLPRPKRH